MKSIISLLFIFVLLSSVVFAATQTVELNLTVKNSLKQIFEKYEPMIIGFGISIAIVMFGFIIYLLLRKALQ